MDKMKYLKYLILLLIGSLVCSFLTGFPFSFGNIQDSQEDAAIEASSSSVSSDSLNGETISANGTTNASIDCVSGNSAGATLSQNGTASGVNLPPLEFQAVDDSYFDDAVFIGDSRIVSLYLYSDWKNATYYCSSGMTLGGVFKDPTGQWKDGNWKENIATALQEQQFKKVYIMIGINDMGVGDLDYFVNHYTDMLLKIREWQPNAIVYIMSIMNVSEERDAKGDYINNEAIRERNEKLQGFADGQNIFYLDINSAVCDENGYLTADYTFDGVHLYAQYVPLWTDYLKAHAIVKP